MTDTTALSADKQFDFAKEAITQVITLASAILALSLTFASGWANGATAAEKILLQASWCLMIVSLLAGLLALLALSGTARVQQGHIGRPVLRVPWLVQLVLFFLGLVMLLAFGISVV